MHNTHTHTHTHSHSHTHKCTTHTHTHTHTRTHTHTHYLYYLKLHSFICLCACETAADGVHNPIHQFPFWIIRVRSNSTEVTISYQLLQRIMRERGRFKQVTWHFYRGQQWGRLLEHSPATTRGDLLWHRQGEQKVYPQCYNTCTKTRKQTDRQTDRQRDRETHNTLYHSAK